MAESGDWPGVQPATTLATAVDTRETSGTDASRPDQAAATADHDTLPSACGPLGFGWLIALPMISRKTDKSDISWLAGAEELIPALVWTDGAWTRGEERCRLASGFGS